jgi:hypothetical protein
MENMVGWIVYCVYMKCIASHAFDLFLEHYVKCVQNNSTKSQAEQLKQLFLNIKKTTAKEDLLWNIKMEMLVTVARREG